MVIQSIDTSAGNQNQRNERLSSPYQQTVFLLIGFDRLSFVDDITNAIPQNEQCRITNLLLEGDGVRAKGQLTVDVADAYHLALIDRRLRSVRGLVSINKTN